MKEYLLPVGLILLGVAIFLLWRVLRRANPWSRTPYEQQEAFAVQKHHLDTNHHVNNCQYVQMAMDYLPADFRIHQMRAEYKQQARLHDVICPARAVEDTKTTILLNDQKSEPYAIVEFM